MERKKSKHNISYPTIIDMDRFLGPPDPGARKRGKKGDLPGKNVYQLRGVLLHKGASAYHGHYEAQVFDVQYVHFSLIFARPDWCPRTQSWYQFNDEVVTKINSLGAKMSNGTTKASKIT